ncbi:Mss4-like protein [Hysterangium stoloniferum]|nr:Mss4-like protein [Hysterangium stoloniferum]
MTTCDVPLEGACFCGAITFAAAPPILLKAYCHCSNCQRLSGCPFIHTVHFPKSTFKWTHGKSGEDPLTTLDGYSLPNKPHKTRYRCKTCAVCVASYNAEKEKWSIWGALFPRGEDNRLRKDVWEVIKPDAHIFYDTRMVDINDDLEKWDGYKDISTRLG